MSVKIPKNWLNQMKKWRASRVRRKYLILKRFNVQMAGKYDDNISVISVWINYLFQGWEKHIHCFFFCNFNMIDAVWNLKIYLDVHISIKINKRNSELEKKYSKTCRYSHSIDYYRLKIISLINHLIKAITIW